MLHCRLSETLPKAAAIEHRQGAAKPGCLTQYCFLFSHQRKKDFDLRVTRQEKTKPVYVICRWNWKLPR